MKVGNKIKRCITQTVGDYWLFGISLILLGFAFGGNVSCCAIKENIVLTFVGILATFVVVGNYAQVKSIEDKMENKILEIEKNIQFLKSVETKSIDFILSEINKIADDIYNNTGEIRRDAFRKLDIYKDSKSPLIWDKIFEIVENVADKFRNMNEKKIALANDLYYWAEEYLLMVPEEYFEKYGNMTLNIARDLAHATFFHSNYIAPAQSAFLLLNITNKSAKNRKISNLLLMVDDIYKEIKNRLEAQKPKDFKLALELLEVFSRDKPIEIPKYGKELDERIKKEMENEKQ